MTKSERANVIFIIHSHSGISNDYLNKRTDEELERMYKERVV